MTNAAPSPVGGPAPVAKISDRLMSLDALRGFDMLLSFGICRFLYCRKIFLRV